MKQCYSPQGIRWKSQVYFAVPVWKGCSTTFSPFTTLRFGVTPWISLLDISKRSSSVSKEAVLVSRVPRCKRRGIDSGPPKNLSRQGLRTHKKRYCPVFLSTTTLAETRKSLSLKVPRTLVSEDSQLPGLTGTSPLTPFLRQVVTQLSRKVLIVISYVPEKSWERIVAG